MSLTASNSIITLVQPVLFPQPQQLQGFATDDVTDVDGVNVLEAMMGVDGVLSFGFVWTEVTQTITLQADSASNEFFDAIGRQQQAAQDVYALSGQVVLPAIGRKFLLVNGALKTWKPMPAVKKILQARSFSLVWNRIVPAPL